MHDINSKQKKIIRKALRITSWFFIGVLGLLITTSIVSYIYKDKIIEFVTNELGNQINGEVKIRAIDISFWSSFPNVSIQLHDLLAKSTPGVNVQEFRGYNTDTALVAGRLSFTFNVIDFFQEQYIVQEIKVKNAIVYFFMDEKGKHNWNFIKESQDTVQSQYFVELSKISFYKTLAHVHVSSEKLYAKQYFSHAYFSGKFDEKAVMLQVDSDITSHFVRIKNDEYFSDISLEFAVSVKQSQEKLSILSSQIKTNYADASFVGSFVFKKNEILTNFEYSLKVPDIRKIQEILPESTAKILEDIQLRGTLLSKGKIEGSITDKKMPSLMGNVSYSKGSFTYNKRKFEFETEGLLATNNIEKLTHYSYSGSSFLLSYNNTSVRGTLSVLDFSNMLLDISSSFSADLSDVTEFVDTYDYLLKGKTFGSFEYKGLLADLENFSPQLFTRSKLEIDLKLEDVKIIPPANSPYEFSQVYGKISCQNQHVDFDSIQGTLQGSPFTLQAKAPGLLTYLLFPSQNAMVNAQLYVENLHVDPFVTHYETVLAIDSSSNGSLRARIDFSSKLVRYEKYRLADVSCVLVYSDTEIEVQQTKFKTLQGSYSGKTKLSFLPNNTMRCEGFGEFQAMSAKELFKTFNNFDQQFLTESQINGKISAKFSYSMILDSDYNPHYPTMKIESSVIIEDGEIKNFDPFIQMGKKMKVEEFNTVSFLRIQNTLTIDKDTLYIPNMKINSNAFEMNFAGKHALNDNEFGYYITLFMKKTMTNMFRKKNSGEDFGDIEQNADGNIRVPIKIYGNPDKYSVDYDFKTSVQNIKQGFERQKDEWRTILGKDPATPEPQKEKPADKPIQSGFQIEYD